MDPQQHLTIMILEDNRADVYLLKQALKQAELNFTGVVFEDGEKALEYLESEARPTMPDLAILDLNVPKQDGSQVLAYIRGSPRYRELAVVMFSSSPKQYTRDKAAQADCYLVKPAELEAFLKIGEEIRDCLASVRAGRPLSQLAEAATSK